MTYEYLAGFFDGEGCITVQTRRTGAFSPMAFLTNSHLPTLVEIQESFGGSLRACGPWPNKTTQQLTIYRLAWHGKAALELLQQLLPYLRAKREQADFLIEASSKITRFAGKRKITPEEKDLRQRFAAALKDMKHRDYPAC
jgi:hypothetical protein